MRHALLGFLGLLGLSLVPLHATGDTQNTEIQLSEKNLTESQHFFAENKNKPEVVTLSSGLQYKIVNEGSGTPPGPTDFVTVHYKGTLLNGTEFDSSLNDKNPPTFAVNAVIPGWTEALQLMKPGAKWILYIPPELGYGTKGSGKLIGPNTALIFEIQLISVKPSLDDNPDSSTDEFEDPG